MYFFGVILFTHAVTTGYFMKIDFLSAIMTKIILAVYDRNMEVLKLK